MLNPDSTIILIGVQRAKRILIGFHPEPGNYQIHVPPETRIEHGARWDFCCPVCQEDLVTEENENLCALSLRDGHERRRVLFSRIAGEKATFVVADRRVEWQYGEHVEGYLRHFIQLKYFV
jgi:hypothetical protein